MHLRAPISNPFTSNQFKRYEYIQGIWEMQNFMKNTMVKKILARAHFRARTYRIFCFLSQILMIFEFSKRNEIWRAPRADVRARQNFFYHHIVHEILHLLDILDVFISLKLIAVDVFEMYAFS